MKKTEEKPKRNGKLGAVGMAVILLLFLIQSWNHDKEIFSLTGTTVTIQREDWVGFFLAFFVLLIWLSLGGFIYYLVRKTKEPPPEYAQFLNLQEEENEEEKLWRK